MSKTIIYIYKYIINFIKNIISKCIIVIKQTISICIYIYVYMIILICFHWITSLWCVLFKYK